MVKALLHFPHTTWGWEYMYHLHCARGRLPEAGSGMELGWQAGSKHLCLLSYLASLHHNFLEIS